MHPFPTGKDAQPQKPFTCAEVQAALKKGAAAGISAQAKGLHFKKIYMAQIQEILKKEQERTMEKKVNAVFLMDCLISIF